MNSPSDCGMRIADCGLESGRVFLTIRNPQSAFRNRIILLCLLVFTASAARAQEAKAAETAEARAGAPRTGAITGRVVGEDGRPLADAVVAFYRPFASGLMSPLTATSDGEGKFRLSGLEPGLYVVNAMLPGFVNPQEMLIEPGEAKYSRLGDFVNLTLVKGGVITGTVRDANGDAVVAVPVRAVRVREATGRTAGRYLGFVSERLTDDRGVYRLYGVPPGTYVVSAGGGQRPYMMLNAYEGDAPTYFPSSTRDTAAEVSVRGGEEATGIDIRYRGERGHIVSGAISGAVEANMQYGISVILRQTSASAYEAVSFVSRDVKNSFSFSGVADGEYELMAQQWGGKGDSVASIPRRIKVKGANVTGIELALTPLSSIAGRVQLEAAPKENCDGERAATISETVINARRDDKTQAEDSARIPFFSVGGTVPNEQGEFTVRNLTAGSYRLMVRRPGDGWYVRSITSPGATPNQSTAPAKSAETNGAVLPHIVTLKTGERIANVTINIAQDGATLRGRVVNRADGADGASLPANLKVYLVPAERERANDTLRYAEASVEASGVFALANLAPGRYWLIARPAPESELRESRPRPLAWDAEPRTKLRRDAEAANAAIELKPCQRVADYELRHTPPAAKP